MQMSSHAIDGVRRDYDINLSETEMRAVLAGLGREAASGSVNSGEARGMLLEFMDFLDMEREGR